MTTVAVVVPTFRRPEALRACLVALDAQARAADEVLVVTRRDDPEARAVAVATSPAATILEIDERGVLAAMVAGVRASSSAIVCFTDDDAVSPPDWLGRIEATFERSELIGGVGGRDVLVDPDGAERVEERTEDVGRLTWFGRHVGNHHRGEGRARPVAFLKGVNAAYRREAIGLPIGLRGEGAQAHFEVAVGRYARTRGWDLVYDPELTVWHHPAVRQGADQRDRPEREAVADAAYNLVVAMGRGPGLRRVPYAVVVGDRGAPGVARAAVATLRRDAPTRQRLGPSLRGTLAGGAALLRGADLRYETFA